MPGMYDEFEQRPAPPQQQSPPPAAATGNPYAYRPPSEPAAVQASALHCIKCGYNLTGVAVGSLCPECGTSVEHSIRRRQQGAGPQNGMAITSLVCGVAGIVLGAGCAPLGIAAVITGLIARKQMREGHYADSGNIMSILGIVFGAINTLLGLLVIGFLVFAMAASP